ncbi:MAG: shikimate dehydrogenase [Helicobacter sp.]|nr:shikimate dehydrogenase [Helicobacter sp.]
MSQNLQRKNFCVFGNPISHSLSPKIHNHAFAHFQKELGFLGIYRAIELDALDPMLKETFLSQHFSGANVTSPFKENAFLIADFVDKSAQDIRAANTLMLKDDKIHAYNTDILGFANSLKNLSFENALVLGTGGAARAVISALNMLSEPICILNQSSNFRGLDAKFPCFSTKDFKIAQFDLIINATSALDPMSGLSELQAALFKNAKIAYDINYKESVFLQNAKSINEQIQIKDGKNMLLYQAALSFQIWTGIDAKAAFKVMQEIL